MDKLVAKYNFLNLTQEATGTHEENPDAVLVGFSKYLKKKMLFKKII